MTATHNASNRENLALHLVLRAVEDTIEQLRGLGAVYAAAVSVSSVRDLGRLTGQGRSTVSRWANGDMPALHALMDVSWQMRRNGCG